MAAPRGLSYTPRTGPLAGQTFTAPVGASPTAAYNLYQKARAQALGFTRYSQERAVRQANRQLFQQERAGARFGPAGKLPAAQRTRLTQILGQFQGDIAGRFVDPATGKVDRRVGGSLDRFLQALGRRNGTETWPVGETP